MWLLWTAVGLGTYYLFKPDDEKPAVAPPIYIPPTRVEPKPTTPPKQQQAIPDLQLGQFYNLNIGEVVRLKALEPIPGLTLNPAVDFRIINKTLPTAENRKLGAFTVYMGTSVRPIDMGMKKQFTENDISSIELDYVEPSGTGEVAGEFAG